jgi:hypothetical protein
MLLVTHSEGVLLYSREWDYAGENLINNGSSIKRLTLEVDWNYYKIPFFIGCIYTVYIEKEKVTKIFLKKQMKIYLTLKVRSEHKNGHVQNTLTG